MYSAASLPEFCWHWKYGRWKFQVPCGQVTEFGHVLTWEQQSPPIQAELIQTLIWLPFQQTLLHGEKGSVKAEDNKDVIDEEISVFASDVDINIFCKVDNNREDDQALT